ncbi:hypothetical protein Nepgr_016048 [Nepenthes gracilis]|uniref:Uncharacterized protein n=1 Tax=Nepenthes gracilis TaxID=150966 RepID=A0AAD3SPC6_NEPGR|nr:hypothetical protein Nepgr_016048 [Nepenthes gracilis]
MGISFKISKTGSRFKPKPVIAEETAIKDAAENSAESSRILSKNESNTSNTIVTSAGKLDGRDEDAARFSGSSLSSGGHLISSDVEVSFIVNLYPDGYSIAKPSENDDAHLVALQDGSKLLHPYDRASESLFSAIESGRLPGDILDDIPCKYVDGGLICEVRDYRKCISESGSSIPTVDGSATTTKVRLKMSLENVVKDIPLIADDSWTYRDLMEVESLILKVLQPKLCLDPTPRFDRLCANQISSKLNLGCGGGRKRRLRQISEVPVSSTGLHDKKICKDRVAESSGYKLGEPGDTSGDTMAQHFHENTLLQNIGSSNIPASRARSLVQDASVPVTNVASQQSKLQLGAGSQRIVQDPFTGTVMNSSGASSAGRDMMISYTDNVNSTSLLHGKMENQDVQLSQFSTSNKRARIVGSEGVPQQQMGLCIDGFQGDVQWRNPALQQQANPRGIQYVSTGIQRYSQLVREGASSQDIATSVPMGQQGMRPIANAEPIKTEKSDKSDVNRAKNDTQMLEAENNNMGPRLQQRLSQNLFMPRGVHQGSWNNLTQQVEKDPRKEDQLQKMKLVQSPRFSAGALAQSPLSAKSEDLPCVPLGTHYGAVSSSALPGQSQREKSGVTPVVAAPRSQSVTSSGNDSMQQQHQAQVAAKRRSNSLPKTPGMSGVGSPASVSNVSLPMNAASPSVGTPPLVDQIMLEKFSKIKTVTMRHQLNFRKTKADNDLRKPHTFSAQDLQICLSNAATNENIEDDSCEKSLSKSLVGGSMNSCKIRVLSFVQAERAPQGNTLPVASMGRTRLIMSEKPNDGTVAMHYGDVEDADYLKAEDHLHSLPNTHIADLLAAQFRVLMIRDGYYVEDHVQPRPPHLCIPTSSQPNAPAIPPIHSAAEIQQYAEGISGPQTNEVAKPIMSGNASLNLPVNVLASTGMLPPGNPQALPIVQGLMPGVSISARPQQSDPQQSLQQQQLSPPNQQSLLQMQQQQQPHSQRSLLMAANTHSQLNTFGQNSNLSLGNQMVSKPSPLQLLQQQQSQPQVQQSQMQRKMMMGLGPAVGIGNIGNNMGGLGGLGNVMGIGGPRGMGGTGISASMGTIPGIGNMGQSPMGITQASNFSNAISQHFRSGALTPAQAALFASRLRMAQSRGILAGPQSPVASISASRQLQPGSAGHRGNLGSIQRSALGSMAAPKLMTGVGMNAHMSQQQQLLLQQQPQQQQQQMLLQQQQMQQQPQQPPPLPPPQQMQQQEASPLQAVVSPPQVSSPSTLGIPQPLTQPLAQPQQQASPQLSSGAMHPMSGGNPEAGPASPQLSSQTLGSVGSITNSPLELQAANKSNSISNA